jgi:hypothetical protein
MTDEGQRIVTLKAVRCRAEYPFAVDDGALNDSSNQGRFVRQMLQAKFLDKRQDTLERSRLLI